MKKAKENQEIIEEEMTNPASNHEVVTDWKDMYIRLYADMENLKKRMFKEKEDAILNTKSKMIDPILDMDNDLNIALKSFKEIPQGVNLIVNKIKSFLESQGIKEIETSIYNKDLHEVINILETGDGEKVIDVVSKGYKIGDKIIRYPKIILSR